jgi:hypothetical protein
MDKPWRRGVAVIVSTGGTKDRWFESRQGVCKVYRTFNIKCNAILCNSIRIVIVCRYLCEVTKKYSNVIVCICVKYVNVKKIFQPGNDV